MVMTEWRLSKVPSPTAMLADKARNSNTIRGELGYGLLAVATGAVEVPARFAARAVGYAGEAVARSVGDVARRRKVATR